MASHIHFEWDPAPEDQPVEWWNLYQRAPGTDTFEQVVEKIVEPRFSLLMDGQSEGIHTFAVTAANQFAESAMSETVTADFRVPQAPTGLTYSVD